MNIGQPNLKKTKVDFISDLLKTAKINNAEKERVFSLVAKEIENFGNQDHLILSEIEAIKLKLRDLIDDEPASTPEPKSVEQKIQPYINPEGNAKFLLELNQNPLLKSITHNIDSSLLKDINEVLQIESYDFDMHLSEIKIRYKRLSGEFRGKTSKGLSEKIFAYINGNAAWSEDKIRMNWSHRDLASWAEKNAGRCPNAAADVGTGAFAFSRIQVRSGKHITNMVELVHHFKSQISVRSENSLRNLCQAWSFEFENKAQIDFDGLKENIEFFTDVEKLHQAYRRLIELCIDANKESVPEIVLSLSEEHIENDMRITFSIWHKNSVFKKSIGATMERYGEKFTGLINNQLNGLCNWALEADFGAGDYARLSIWPRIKNAEKIDQFQGVRHLLIFNY